MFLTLLISFAVAAPGQGASSAPSSMSIAYDFDMQEIAAALGVTCQYCHGRPEGGGITLRDDDRTPLPTTSSGKQRLDVALEMMTMTLALNQTLSEATGKPPDAVGRVQCVTCHRGMPIPQRIEDVLWQTATTSGAEAAVEQYRELRSRFYGRAVYDFDERPVLWVAERLASARPDIALALVAMNLEFFPRSADSFLIRSQAQVRQRDFDGAIESLRMALEIEPDNMLARGRLYQLEQR